MPHDSILPRTVAVDSDRAARRFCGAVVLWAVTAWAAVAALNWVVNPYAQYSTLLLPPRVKNTHAEKLHLLQRVEPPPEGLILGSSRVMKLEPEYLQACTGWRFFNAGVNYGKPEDALALLRSFREATGAPPRMVVLGLDVVAFSEQQPVDARLLTLAPLVGHIREILPIRDRGRRWRELLSWQQTRASLHSLAQWAVGEELPAEEEESFRPDGLLVYHRRERELREGQYDFAMALDQNQREYASIYSKFDRISPWRCELLEQLMQTCRQDGTRLVLFITPMHPSLDRSLASINTRLPRKRELVEQLRCLAERHACEFHDLSELSSFAGDPQAFVDGIHPLELNTRRMIDRLTETRTQLVGHAL